MEIDCSKLMFGSSRRDGWETIGGLGPCNPPPSRGYAPDFIDLGPPFQGSAIPEVRHSGVLLLIANLIPNA